MLSKSQYVRGLQCEKSLWMLKNQPELKAADDYQKQALFRTGHRVGELAMQLFPGGIEIEFSSGDYDGMKQKTHALIEAGEKTIYEATFSDDERGMFAMADILHLHEDGWHVYEVKASTRVKQYHLDDAAFQWNLINKFIPLKRIHIVHINNQYEREGELDVQALFAKEDVTDEVLSRQDEVDHQVGSLNSLITSDKPTVDIGPHCDSPHACDFKDHCWAHIPSHSVFNLYRLDKRKKFSLYEQGIELITDLPENFALGDIQQLQVWSEKSDAVFVDRPLISQFLCALKPPLSFFDFETFMDAIPRFTGQRPYMAIPFQYSLHIRGEDGGLSHKEFLGEAGADPREQLIRHMLADLPEQGSILAFNVGFEKARIRELADCFPDYEPQLSALLGRFVDLIDPFRRGAYYHPDFNGSLSIKSVLPAMFPNSSDLQYEGLTIKDGSMAMDIYANLDSVEDPAEEEAIRQDLLAYCRLDTFAMVKILDQLTKLVAH